MIYQRKPTARSMGVYGVSAGGSGLRPRNVVATGRAPCPNGYTWGPTIGSNGQPVMACVPAAQRLAGRRMGGLTFHGFGATFGDDSSYVSFDPTTDLNSPDTTSLTGGPGSTYWQTINQGVPSTTSTTVTSNGDIPTSGSGQDFTSNLQNNPAADAAAAGSSGGSAASTQSWFNTGTSIATGVTNTVGGVLKMFGIGGGSGTPGTGSTAGNSSISLAVLGAAVLGIGALYLVNSKKKG